MNLSGKWLSVALMAGLFVLYSPRLESQVAGGTILGTVTDSSKAVIPHAKVTVRNSQTNVERIVVANDEGFFRAPNLLPGDYGITVDSPGFHTLKREDITLSVGMELSVDLQLQVGEATEQVTVTGEPPAVDLGSSSLGATINGTTVRELPLNGRDWTQLAILEPGVASLRTQAPLSVGNERSNRGLGAQLAVGGSRPLQNNYRLDGISINDHSNGAPGSSLGVVVGVDAIQEFSVITNNPSASYGRTAGGVINAITRSGTNSLHGAVYEFARNSVFDARNYFDKAGVPPFSRNQFGASAGGPIVKSRTFIFGDYEGLRQNLSVTQLTNVPSAAARNGQLVAGQITVDPRVKPYLDLYPLPNGTITGDTGIFNTPTQQTTREDFFTIRVDHKISSSDSIFGTYLFDDGDTQGPDAYFSVVTGYLTRRQAAIVEETHIFSPSLLNSFRVGYSRPTSEAPKNLSAINPIAADPSLGFLPGRPVGGLTVTGLTRFAGGLGSAGEYDFHTNSYQLYDDAFWTKGDHSLKFGASVERIQANQLAKSTPSGEYTFSSLANFLTNKPITFASSLGIAATPRDLRDTIFGAYVQDDWRARPNLTFNLGLRYEMATVPTEASGKLSNLASLADPQPRLGSPYFENPSKRNFEPRVGFSWDPFHTGATSVRGGFGINDNLALPYQFLILSALTAPYFQLGTIANPPQGSFPTGAFGLLGPNQLRYGYVDSHPHRNYVMQWNFNVQRQITSGVTLLLGYVGSRGVHMPYQDTDVNYVQPTLTPQGYLFPTPKGSGTKLNPKIGQIQAQFWTSSSTYHSFQSRVTLRLKHGIQGGASYTWSKAIDTGSSSSVSGDFLNSVRHLWFDPKSGRGLADYDQRHNFVLNYIWQIPGPHLKSSILNGTTNGWQFGGIFQASSGTPFTPSISGDPLGMNSSGGTFDFPDRLAGPGCNTLVNPGNPTQYIKTQCFGFPSPATRLGNVARNSLTGPGLTNVDMSIFKNNPIKKISETFNA